MAARQPMMYRRRTLAASQLPHLQLVDEIDEDVTVLNDLPRPSNIPANAEIHVVDDDGPVESPHDPRALVCFCIQCQVKMDFNGNFILPASIAGNHTLHYLCGICLQRTTEGTTHHPSNLCCGHVYGVSCIARWLLPGFNQQCPYCKRAARMSNLRLMFGLSPQDDLLEEMWCRYDTARRREEAMEAMLATALELNSHLHETMRCMWILNSAQPPSP